MSDKQCSSCGGICNPSGCERENEPEALFTVNDKGRWEETDDPNGTPLYTAQAVQPLTDEQERKAFEAWCFSVGLMQLSYGIMAVNSQTETAWLAWKARAAHGIGAPKE